MSGKSVLKIIGGIFIILLVVGGFGYLIFTPRSPEPLKYGIAYESSEEILRNTYSVILVNPEKHPDANLDAAAEFAKWLISKEGQDAIASYEVSNDTLFTASYSASSLPADEQWFWGNITIGKASGTIILATTTSTRDSGLLDFLLPKFYEVSKVRINVVALGTGAALDTAKQGNADIVMVHAKSLELEFVQEGHGIHRVEFMYNTFVLLGPESDPAGVKNATSIVEAFQRIYFSKSLFISRGDNSGTNVKELLIWDMANITILPTDTTWASQNKWYIETGQGMSATIRIAIEKNAYTLSDKSTWLFYTSS